MQLFPGPARNVDKEAEGLMLSSQTKKSTARKSKVGQTKHRTKTGQNYSVGGGDEWEALGNTWEYERLVGRNAAKPKRRQILVKKR